MLVFRSLTAAALVAGALTALAAPALAAGDDSTSTPACAKGKVYDQKKKTCVQAKADAVDDQSFAATAYALAKGGRYEEALAMLDLMKDQKTAEALNYRGYATRKLGRTEEGIGYYKQAVTLAPDYTLVREYLGEAYVIQGKLDLAREQLAEIRKRCGTTCEPYEDLDHMITTGREG